MHWSWVFNEAPSVEAVSAGRWHETADHCKNPISILPERIEEHEDRVSTGLLPSGGVRGGLDTSMEIQG